MLNDNLEAKTFKWNPYRRKKGHKTFEGEIIGNTFKATRIINYRNSLVPTIKGKIESDYAGTKINIKMSLHLVVYIFLSFWFGIVMLAAAASVYSFMNSESFEPMILIPFGMLIFGYLLTILAFNFEKNKAKEMLENLFEAEIEQT